MLDHAKLQQPNDDRIEWKHADAQVLPFQDESFDAVACQFGVMFFPDKVKGYKEARRVLKPGGRFFFNVWDKISENDLPMLSLMHDLQSCLPQRLNQRTSCAATADFFNTIGHKRTSRSAICWR